MSDKYMSQNSSGKWSTKIVPLGGVFEKSGAVIACMCEDCIKKRAAMQGKDLFK